MSQYWPCLIYLLVATSAGIWIIILSRGAVKSVYFPRGWRDVLEAWRSSKTWGERVVVLLLVLQRSGYWALAAAAITGICSIAASGCGFDLPKVLARIREILRDYYEYKRSVSAGVPVS